MSSANLGTSESRRCMTSRVHGERLHCSVRDVQNGAARGFVHATGFHAHETVLDHIDAADSVRAGDIVEAHQQTPQAPVAPPSTAIGSSLFEARSPWYCERSGAFWTA